MNIKNDHNLPVRLKQSDYEECVDMVCQEALVNPTIHSIYLMGGRWCPGLSDLDIVAIYKDGLRPQPLSSPWSLSNKARFIFTHRYLSFNQSAAEHFYSLYPKETANLRHIAGAEQIFLPTTNNNRQWTLAFILFDVFFNKLLLLGRFKKSGKNIRQLLGSLYSLVYTSWMVREISGVDIDDGFGKRIGELRESWFALTDEVATQKLSILLDEGILLVSRAVANLDRFVSGLVSENFGESKFSNTKFAAGFTAQWSHQRFVGEFDKSLIWDSRILNRKIESFRLLLPNSFSIFFQAYARGEGEFSDLMRQHLTSLGEGVERPLLSDHVRAVNLAYKSSRASGGLFKIPYSYGFPTGKQNLRGQLFWRASSLLRDIR